MAQKILIFKILFLLLLFNNNVLNAKNIIGKPKVIDGDTVHINHNKIRLHGIDAPEKNQKCMFNKKEWLCGKQATIELKKLIKNEMIKCEITDVDIYKRYVGICFVNKTNLNQIMVKNGWALAYRYYSTDYINEERYARKNNLGIWQGEFENPYIFRKKNK
jgi:endonuclease YncB( thermonuclease family)